MKLVGKETAQKEKSYIPIELNSLRIDSTLDFRLYIHVGREYVLFRDPRLPFTEKTRQTLIDNGVVSLYVEGEDRRTYNQYIESHLMDIVHDPDIEEDTKSGIVYECAKSLVTDLLDNPGLPENLRRSIRLVESTTMHLIKSQRAFYSLLNVMSFDYTIFTHSVNVCALSIALARRLGIDDQEKLHHIGTGALLHDIGKSKISTDILDKRGPLTDTEMAVVKRHPQYGFGMVLESEIIPYDAHYPILEHHEREDGTGYPYGLTAPKIHQYSKIVAVADVFDAMTTNRSYRRAKEAFPALNEMYDTHEKFNRTMLDTFTTMLGPENLNFTE